MQYCNAILQCNTVMQYCNAILQCYQCYQALQNKTISIKEIQIKREHNIVINTEHSVTFMNNNLT